MFPNLPFDVRRDIALVSGLVVYPMVLVAHPSVPAKTVAELIAHAKANARGGDWSDVQVAAVLRR